MKRFKTPNRTKRATGRTDPRTAGLALFSLLSVFLAGCSSPAFEVGVVLSPDLKSLYGYYPSIEVDFAGITPAERQRVENYSVDRWFDSGNPLRASLAKKTLRFSEDAVLRQTISEKDPVWDDWEHRGAVYLVVFANLPHVFETADGAPVPDPRRLTLPMRSEHWYKSEGGAFWLEVGAGGIVELANEPEEEEVVFDRPQEELQGDEPGTTFSSGPEEEPPEAPKTGIPEAETQEPEGSAN